MLTSLAYHATPLNGYTQNMLQCDRVLRNYMLKTVAVTKAIVSLNDVRDRFGLREATDDRFFPEWQENLPEIDRDDRAVLDRLKARYFYYADAGFLTEGTVKTAIVAPLLEVAKLYDPPYQVRAEQGVRIQLPADEEGLVLEGFIDFLVSCQNFWIAIIEAKRYGLNVSLALPQTLAYMMADRTNDDRPLFGLATNGEDYIFLKSDRALTLYNVRMNPNIVRQNPRQVAFLALQDVYKKDAYADVALDRQLNKASLSPVDRRLATELVYGCVRRQRTLDFIVDRLAKKSASKQPPDLRIILHLGLYQLRYLQQVPDAAAVDTTVELTKTNKLAGLAGFVNGLLRQSLRTEPLENLPEHPVERLGILYSYPDWIIETWQEQFGLEEAEELCKWYNRSPTIHLRVNPLQADMETVEAAMGDREITTQRVANLSQTLHLLGSVGSIEKLPGFDAGWWTVQDSSAQLVTYLLDPQPGEFVVDACAAPGGKTTHIAELMADRGTIWACDRAESRLKKVTANARRLQLNSIQTLAGDSRNFSQFQNQCDRVLVDAPCSGLGTLHRRADLRWRQTRQRATELADLQLELLEMAATWVKPEGVLVYATCTLHPPETVGVVRCFLDRHGDWKIEPPPANFPVPDAILPSGSIEVRSHRQDMDGFFMVKLRHH